MVLTTDQGGLIDLKTELDLPVQVLFLDWS